MSAPGQRSKTVGRRMMADGATDRHNVLAPEAVKMIVTGTNYEVTEAMTVLESIVLGVIGFHVLRFKPGGDRLRAGSEYLDMLTSRRTEEHTSELQSLMRISYAVFSLHNKL